MKRIFIILIAYTVLGGCSLYNPKAIDSSWKFHPQKAKYHFPAKRETHGKRTFVFSPQVMAWAAYDEEGRRVEVGPASGGVDSCPEDGNDCRTATGHFTVQRKGDSSCISKTYPLGEGGAPMPYCMFFHQGYAIHGASGVPNVHSSHGCIRVNVSDARWLNQDFLQVGSRVIVEAYASSESF